MTDRQHAIRELLWEWGAAGRGNRWVDVAFAFLNLRVEGAEPPDVGLPQEGDYAALLSGHFAVEAPGPLPEWAEGSSLREDMVGDLRHALEWTADTRPVCPDLTALAPAGRGWAARAERGKRRAAAG